MNKQLTAGRVLAWAALAAFLVAAVLPFYLMVRTALTPAADLLTGSTSLVPRHPTLVNFWRILGLVDAGTARRAGGSGAQIDFLRYTLHSVVYCGLIATGQTFC